MDKSVITIKDKFKQLESKVCRASDLLDSAIQELQSDYTEESNAMVEGIMDLDDRIQLLEQALTEISNGAHDGKANMGPGQIYDIAQMALARVINGEK